MKYCVECGSEYQDSVKACADCPEGQLVDPETMRQRGLPMAHERDTRQFVRAGTAEDPLTAEDYVRLLEAERIPVIARPQGSGSVDALTTGNVLPWWEILVPAEHSVRAIDLLAREKDNLKATEAEAIRAAEDEERESEGFGAPPPA
ncbi:hypothetical protein POL68_12730 [Stigmatella sp. ncwal1]|uniref:DUF2007 domain-containing protein n=1 Tax=Stigmatella ashevillensis TaxID=2995309 RepID=A0ABT5D6Q8_9BACT|nr:hypothetical protein [Stigmatella ashevillena]MDC0709331.1 hypothetical protein [Stigmatella ashevillena]